VRSKKNRNKCRREKEWDRRHRKFYGFVYRLHNKDLKDNEKIPLKFQLEVNSWTLENCYHPLRYISQQEINTHFNNPETWESKEFRNPCIQVYVKCPFANPYLGHRNWFWIIDRPGYYRVYAEPLRDSSGKVFMLQYKMHHYNGMPYFNYYNDRCYNNYVSRAYHKVLNHYSDIKEQVRRDKRELEMRKLQTYNRLKYKQMLKRDLERMESRKRSKRVSGVMITEQTKSFFQALAIGSELKEEIAC
jgi:hypothetical protein